MTSIKKGHNFERKIVEKFRKGFNLQKSDCFRTPMSGGHQYLAKSDIIFHPEELWKKIGLFIKCKYRRSWKEWNLETLLINIMKTNKEFGKSWKPFRWLNQAKKNCGDSGLVPILVAGRPKIEPLIILNIKDLKDMDEWLLGYWNKAIKFVDYYVFLIDDFISFWKEVRNL